MSTQQPALQPSTSPQAPGSARGDVLGGEVRDRQNFNPVVVLTILLVGAAAFLAMLYFIGTGQTGDRSNQPGAMSSALANGLNGYSAFRKLVEASGRETKIAYSEQELKEADILVLTPSTLPLFENDLLDEESELAAILKLRRGYTNESGPTIVILPKWDATPLRSRTKGTKPGWVEVRPNGARNVKISVPVEGDLKQSDLSRSSGRWGGLGLRGTLPEPKVSRSLSSDSMTPLVQDAAGRSLVGFIDHGYEDDRLYEAIDQLPIPDAPDATSEYEDEDEYLANYAVDGAPVIIVAEADLMNNYGMADANRAALALKIVDLTSEVGGFNSDAPITFDVTMNGMGKSDNLLTLAFKPPFLAATLCLIFALIAVGWRAFARFGPPVTERQAIGFGKERLVANSAALVMRARRYHLLRKPYVELERMRMSAALGVKRASDEALDHALSLRGAGDQAFSEARSALEQAQGQNDIVAAARHLKSLERKLSE